MEIKRAKTQGFCFGVAITVKKAEEAVASGAQVTTLGHVVHNPQMVSTLEEKGLRNADSVDEVESGTLFVRAHGLPVSVYEKAQEKGLTILDATCPMVTKIHVQAEKLRADGYKIIVIGDPNHAEVKGTLSHVPGAWCIQTADDVAALPREVMWYADPAGRTEIEELRRAGLKVRHGDNTIRRGIALAKEKMSGRRSCLAFPGVLV